MLCHAVLTVSHAVPTTPHAVPAVCSVKEKKVGYDQMQHYGTPPYEALFQGYFTSLSAVQRWECVSTEMGCGKMALCRQLHTHRGYLAQDGCSLSPPAVCCASCPHKPLPSTLLSSSICHLSAAAPSICHLSAAATWACTERTTSPPRMTSPMAQPTCPQTLKT